MQRVLVIGNTGAGKSTLARAVAARLGAPHVEMDALWWQAGWTASDPEVFRRRLRAATATERWVVCGNYHSHASDVVWPRADTIVWLDLPLGVVLFRLVRRTLRRIRRREQLWNGNLERWGALFARDSLLVWALKSHGKHRAQYPALFAAPDTAHATTVRLRSPRAVRRWLADVSSSESSARGRRSSAGRPSSPHPPAAAVLTTATAAARSASRRSVGV